MSQQINLFNPIFLKQKKYFSVVTMSQALGLILLGSLAFYGFAWYQVQELARQTQEMTARYAVEQQRLISYANEFSPQKAIQMLNEELRSLEAKRDAQQLLLNTLKSSAIGNTRGYSEYMRAFARQTVSGLWLTGFDISGDGEQMVLQGAVTDPRLVASYIQRMNREVVMRGKSFAALQMKKPDNAAGATPGYVEFSLHSVGAEEDKR
ncbi:MAG: fimbrial assembly protein [Gammaproteobacteria bacterium]|nr:fimbrial assembly protein [Gammaproteobacteria bacterium]MBU1447227.1 fimbrial assembly protein [Gammaproteobacteria bacterium]